MDKIKNYINGELVEPESGKYLDNVEPASGDVYSKIPASDGRDVERAVAAAREAFPGWSRTPADDRSRILQKLADAIETNLFRLARAESIDTGKPLQLAKTLDIPRASRNIRFFATAILHHRSEVHPIDYHGFNYTLRRPRGVVGLITPWNLPLYLLTWKVGPAIATGNTAVAKPSELTPMTAFLLAKICREVGLPPGVLNIVHGAGADAGAAIVKHPEIVAVSFTGGTRTGAEIARGAAPAFKKVALEMGGKNPNIIFADADMDEAIDISLKSSYMNQGQVCTCGERIFVEKKAYRPFVERFVEASRRLRVGDPLEPETDQGAVVSKGHHDKILSYIEVARQEGGTIQCGGGPPESLPARCQNGFFVEPTVITDLPVESRVNCEEIFGPVVTITPFRDEDEVIAAANRTPYGLTASVWTRDLARGHRVAERIDSGTVWINCWMVRDLRVPFGGMKHSGVGREGGEESMRFFTEPKNVCVSYSAEPDRTRK